MEYGFLVIGLVVGIALGWMLAKILVKKDVSQEEELKSLQQVVGQKDSDIKVFESKVHDAKNEIDALNKRLEKEYNNATELGQRNAALAANYKNLQDRFDEQKTEVEQLQKRFTTEFENLANKIFEEKSRKFTDQNKVNITEVLKPLGEKIKEFEKRVDDTNKESIARNSALKEQILGLKELNQRITKEAENLTKALKGDSKAQGNWGEFILESILEKSGLVKDREYFIQQSITNEEGRRLQPDVILKLPENKSIIIDSKVSLVAYERFVADEDVASQEANRKAHLLSIRQHIKGLSEKEYQNLELGKGLDFVLMFIPIEPAFTLAVQSDPELFSDAYTKNIVIVSPTTLIATLRTIASIWKQEYQNRNALEIAKQGGDLYDKFVGFIEDYKKIGAQLNQARSTYEDAGKKLYTGKGNIIRRTELLKDLGAKANKSIDSKLLEKARE